MSKVDYIFLYIRYRFGFRKILVFCAAVLYLLSLLGVFHLWGSRSANADSALHQEMKERATRDQESVDALTDGTFSTPPAAYMAGEGKLRVNREGADALYRGLNSDRLGDQMSAALDGIDQGMNLLDRIRSGEEIKQVEIED